MSRPPNADPSAPPDPPGDAAAAPAPAGTGHTDAGATGAPAPDAATAAGADAAAAGETRRAPAADTGEPTPGGREERAAGDDAARASDDQARARGVDAEGDDPADGAQARRTARPRAGINLSGVVLALLLGLLGFTLVAQVRSLDTDSSLPAARQEELVRILADLDAHEHQLRQEIAELEETLGRLTTAGQSRQEALEEATRRADELGILAGILPVEGPGVTMQIIPGEEPISAARLLDTVQELRGAGAEAIQITDGAGTQVRVVASTYFVDAEGGAVRVDGQLLHAPYTITAVGEPQTLRPALAIPGGVVESVQSAGGTVTVDERPDGVLVTAVREPAALRYASPVS